MNSSSGHRKFDGEKRSHPFTLALRRRELLRECVAGHAASWFVSRRILARHSLLAKR
ncbi:hypothetical protein [Brevundimonas sp.]|uniref:hypothetical protein n=1 Tax=Brevundimonas sp. TaxID=1871086 RepID=UPI0025E88F85|nr:hypothetical protein [Brevundimonas sp.]